MKKLLGIISLFALLAACSSYSSQQIYEWTAHQATFEYPKGYNIIPIGADVLFVTKNEDLNSSATGGFELMITANDKASTDVLSDLSNYSDYLANEKTIGANSVEEVTYTAVSTTGEGAMYTIYVIQDGNKSISFIPGPSYEDLAQVVIESLEFTN